VVGLPLVAVLFVVGYFGVTFLQVRAASHQDAAAPADAIVVLGAAQYDGEPSGALRGRLDHADELWEKGVAPVIVVTGGNQPGDRTTEGLTGFTYLRQLGVPESALLVEVSARSTLESLSASQLILTQRGLRTAVLVSDPYHNLRLRGMADELDFPATVSPTRAHSDGQSLLRETVAVGFGRIVGYDRLSRLLHV
jgi:uncharacterized SAM-binding protein YcdF (DUF218 family)